jgi:ribosomal protein S6E (S10)
MAGAVTSAEAVLTISLPCPHIDSITLVPDKGFQLQIRGGPGSFGIESAPDLLGWTQMTTLTATGAVFQVTDPETNQPSRFYRVRVLE